MLKFISRWPILPAFFTLLSLITLSFVINDQRQSNSHLAKIYKQVLIKYTPKETRAFPMRLKVPSINVDASIQDVGLTSNGSMEVPNNIVDVGWFKLGPRPGEKGSAVIAGHFDGENSQAGVFANLWKLKTGDKLFIEGGKKPHLTFIVRKSRTYEPGYADEVFSANDKVHLNLITCDGIWDKAKKSYSKRLVVFADLAN